jgi:hypothetical protein
LGSDEDMTARPIAIERCLTLKEPSRTEEQVVVSFFVPYRIEQDDWQCDYEIVGGSIQRKFYAVGIDSVQALMLALASTRTDLEYLEKKHSARFHFLGEPGHGLG